MSDVLIRCENVSKRFCRDLRKSLWYGVKDIAREVIFDRTRRLPASSSDVQLRPNEFWANKDISFEVKRGECLGLIGHNGAGKTTLLKMLNGLIKPDTGRIEMRGKIGALIALGAGFNPILTGRENILVNGAILGMSKRQIADRLEEIVDFAELAEFIDTPVRNYSSGMQVRLGFAVSAVLIKPDVLLLDEVLAVGDAPFRFKCVSALAKLMDSSAVILVSHDMAHVGRIASQFLHLSGGQTASSGAGAIDEYFNSSEQLSRGNESSVNCKPPILHGVVRAPDSLKYGVDLSIEISLYTDQPVPSADFRIVIFSNSLTLLAEFDTRNSARSFALEVGRNNIQIDIPRCHFGNGIYYIDVICHDRNLVHQLFWSRHQNRLVVHGAPTTGSFALLSG
jgi:lipopolysaccharide transport system ATP-binding protein